MQVKKFTAETFEEALKEVKRELGSNAIILSKKMVKDPKKGPLSFLSKPFIELTAAIDRRIIGEPEEEIQPQPAAPKKSAPTIGTDAQKATRIGNDLVSLSNVAQTLTKRQSSRFRNLNKKYIDIDDVDTVDSLIDTAKRSLGSQTKRKAQRVPKEPKKQEISKESTPTPPRAQTQSDTNNDNLMAKTPKALKSMCLNLTISGIEPKTIEDIVRSVTENMNPLLIKRENYLEGYVAKYLMDQMKFAGGIQLYPQGPKIVLIMGPTGVGKTTTLAKIAARFQAQGKDVGIITLDIHKIGAVEQLKVYSNILNLPLTVVTKDSELSEAITQMKHCDLILIDSTGRGKKDGEALANMKNMLNLNIPIEKHLCISACMRDNDALASYRRYSILGVDRILFTKLDETSTYGGVYTIMRKTDTPLSYFTLGQRVPEDIEIGTKERLVDLILNLSSN